MKAKDWEVTAAEYDAKGVYTWLHEPRRGAPLAVRISREVLDDSPAWVVLYHLDHLQVARAIRVRPEAHLVIAHSDGAIVLEECSSE